MFQTKLVTLSMTKQDPIKVLISKGMSLLLTSMLSGTILSGTIAIASTPNQVLAQTTTENETETANPANLEALVIQEINRARTNPSAYADWLERQRQYFDGMVLKLPGEKPLRTNRGLKALNEAIAFVRQQSELPAISSASALVTTAQSQVRAIVDNQPISYQDKYFVYGKVTPEAIVMQLIVDDGFPDRRHRRAIFTPDHRQAGIVCSDIAIYDQVCAIAYEVTTEPPTAINPDQTNEVVVATQPTVSTTLETPPAEPTTSEPIDLEPETALEAAPIVEVPTTETTAITSDDSEVIVEAQPEAAAATEPAIEPEEPEPKPEAAPEIINETSEPETEISALPETQPTTQATETIEQGTLQEGDEVIPNDGSFYDSYPISGKAGDTFAISLESQDFDTFLAVMDKEGNIIEQNDDIDEQNSNSKLELTLPNDGDYTVIVNTYDQGGTGDYILKLRR